MEQLKVTIWARPAWFWDKLSVCWSSGSVVALALPMAGIMCANKPLDLHHLCGMGGQGFPTEEGAMEGNVWAICARVEVVGAVGDAEPLGCGPQPFIREAWRRPQGFSSAPKRN